MVANANKPDILVVEDCDEDFFAIRRFLTRGNPTLRLRRCARVEEVFDILDHSERCRELNLALVVLDLNLPGMNGRVVLHAVRNHPDFKTVPIVVFSSSTDPSEVRWCYENGANSYHVKSTQTWGFQRTIETLREYWLQKVRLPDGGYSQQAY